MNRHMQRTTRYAIILKKGSKDYLMIFKFAHNFRIRINTNDDLFVRKDIPLKLTKDEKEKLYLEEGKVRF